MVEDKGLESITLYKHTSNDRVTRSMTLLKRSHPSLPTRPHAYSIHRSRLVKKAARVFSLSSNHLYHCGMCRENVYLNTRERFILFLNSVKG